MGVVRRQINPHAARLRREMTDAEKALWSQLRNRRPAGFKFRSQWSLGPFIADFCCLSAKLVVEADGGQHDEVTDAPRTTWLNEHGFRVLRFWNNEVLTNMDGVLQVILAALKEEDPHPALTRERERGKKYLKTRVDTAPSPARGRRLG